MTIVDISGTWHSLRKISWKICMYRFPIKWKHHQTVISDDLSHYILRYAHFLITHKMQMFWKTMELKILLSVAAFWWKETRKETRYIIFGGQELWQSLEPKTFCKHNAISMLILSTSFWASNQPRTVLKYVNLGSNWALLQW